MKAKKVTIIAIIFTILSISFMPIVSATINPDVYKPSDIGLSDVAVPFKFARTILGALVAAGVVISIVITMYLGIKYMLGSVEERAEYKKTMIPILVGMIMLFCTSTFVAILYNIVTTATTNV